jgi:uncharacterized protein YcnI
MKGKVMMIRRLYLGCIFAGALVVAPSARAHPALQIGEARIGAPYRAIISIPHGCDGTATVKVRVRVPEGLIGAKPLPKPGWTVSTVRGRYAQAYEFYHGQTLSEGVQEVTWTGRLGDDFFDEFAFAGFLAGTLKEGSPLFFPTYQECEKGSYEWIEVPASGQTAHSLKHPAPSVLLLPAAEKGTVQTYRVGSLVIETPWTRATPGGAQVAGGYLKITNTGSQTDRLVGGSLPIAAAVEVHEMSMTDGVMKMRKLDAGLEVKPGQSVELKPGGYHLMFTGLREGVKQGKPVKGTLVFEKAGSVEVEYLVAPIGASSAPTHSHH